MRLNQIPYVLLFLPFVAFAQNTMNYNITVINGLYSDMHLNTRPSPLPFGCLNSSGSPPSGIKGKNPATSKLKAEYLDKNCSVFWQFSYEFSGGSCAVTLNAAAASCSNSAKNQVVCLGSAKADPISVVESSDGVCSFTINIKPTDQ